MKLSKIKIKIILIVLVVGLTYIVSHGTHKHSKSGEHSHAHAHNHNHGHAHNDGHSHSHSNNHNHNHGNVQTELSNTINHYNNVIFDFLHTKLEKFSKKEQAYIGALIISSAPYPIFILILLFNIKNIKILDIMSCFASGALLGDVLLHNLPDILAEGHSHSHNGRFSIKEFLLEKETLICLGVIVLFVIEKIISLNLIDKQKVGQCDKNDNNNKNNKNNENNETDNYYHHGHSHADSNSRSNTTQNIIISVIGDCVHNITDGLAIGAAYSKNLKLGITLTISIFFHEIPHEVGDFSYLLKQKMGKFRALLTQVFAGAAAFFGVYLNFLIGDQFSTEILAFSSGAFLYLSINTILGDLKTPHSVINIILEATSFLAGVFLLHRLI